MVTKMMRWRPWPPPITKKFEVRLQVRCLEGWRDPVCEGAGKDCGSGSAVEIRWKGPKISLGSFRRTVKRNFTREEKVDQNGVVQWDEEFHMVCNLSGYKENVFHPWEIGFKVLNGINAGMKNKSSVIGAASLNLSEYASMAKEEAFELKIPLTVGGTAESCPSLCISLSLEESKAAIEPTEFVQRSVVPVLSSPQSDEIPSGEKDELSVLKAGLRKVKIFTEYVSIRRPKKGGREDETSEGRSDEGEYAYTFESDSIDDFEVGETDEVKEGSTARKSFSYGTLPYANSVVGSLQNSTWNNTEDEDWVYYSHRKSDVGCSYKEDSSAPAPEQYRSQNLKRSILPWKKRKLNFRSPKAKGEPLLKKDYGEEGGDDIDFDRRQFSSDESISWHKVEELCANGSSISEFGDDNFAVGNWERKDITSRDGYMKLETEVFFASIDQRSERAAGESACTALVAVIADWFQNNHNLMPIKSQFDCLIREGSLEWRKLCENETYRKRFPDKHFDLETVLEAQVCSLSVVSGKSFVGFFHPDEMVEGKLDFLDGAMSFDSMWDEISRVSECLCSDEPQVYIVSWNDHFFVLKVEPEAYYIVDTLGERLFEGCGQAFILKFDKDSAIYKVAGSTQPLEQKPSDDKESNAESSTEESLAMETEELPKGPANEELVCRGKETCKEYIKSFLAAIPIRELEADLKKGLMDSTPLHQRLQIEFHYTQLLKEALETTAIEAATNSASTPSTPPTAETEITEVTI